MLCPERHFIYDGIYRHKEGAVMSVMDGTVYSKSTAATGLKAVVAILEKWGATGEQAAAILLSPGAPMRGRSDATRSERSTSMSIS